MLFSRNVVYTIISEIHSELEKVRLSPEAYRKMHGMESTLILLVSTPVQVFHLAGKITSARLLFKTSVVAVISGGWFSVTLPPQVQGPDLESSLTLCYLLTFVILGDQTVLFFLKTIPQSSSNILR